MSLQDREPDFREGRCVFNPLHKTNFCSDSAALSLAGALSVSSAYYKILDDIKDSSFFKRLLLRILLPVFFRWNNKVRIKYPFIDRALSNMVDEQFEIEKDENAVLDKACDPTAKMLSLMCESIPKYIDSSVLKNNDASPRILRTFGYYLGRWIYLIDAADDFEDDIKSGNFNPFRIKYGDKADLDDMISLLNHSLSEMMLSYELLDKGRYDIIVSNIIFLGLPKKQKEVLKIYIEDREKIR